MYLVVSSLVSATAAGSLPLQATRLTQMMSATVILDTAYSFSLVVGLGLEVRAFCPVCPQAPHTRRVGATFVCTTTTRQPKPFERRHYHLPGLPLKEHLVSHLR